MEPNTRADEPPVQPTEDMPLLGETFAVEFANSRYVGDEEELDLLAEPATAAAWFAAAEQARDLPCPGKVSPADLAALRRVRNATREILDEVADSGGQLAATSATWHAAAEVLHAEASCCAAHLSLEAAADGRPVWRLHHRGTDSEVLRATAAGRCILFLGGEDVWRVRRCQRPACPMLFVQRHRARRFCHDGCAHSVRQARYYRRSRSRTGAHGTTAQ